MDIATTLLESEVEKILALVRSRTDEQIVSFRDGERGQRSRLAASTAIYGSSVELRPAGRFCEEISGQHEHIITQPAGFIGRGDEH